MIRNVVGSLSFTGWDFALAVAVIVAAWVAARYARRTIERVLIRVKVPEDVRTLGGRFGAYLVLFLGVGIALGFLGVSIQPVLAVVILIAVVAFLALRGVADNIAAGVIIQTRQSLHIGDLIESLGYSGKVREFTSRSVIIECSDGRVVHLPNQNILDEPLVNHTTAGRAASEVQIRVEGQATPPMIATVREALSRAPGVRAEPAPRVLVQSVEPRRSILSATYWHDPAAAAVVRSAVVVALSDRLASIEPLVSVTAPPPAPPLVPPPNL